MKQKKLSVLICGKIRVFDEFKAILTKYREWRDADLIDRIVLSGWASDYDLYSSEIEAAAEWGLEVVLSPDPNLAVTAHIIHQQKALRYGLSLFEPHDIILKSRTDRTEIHLNPEAVTARFHAAPPPAGRSPFRHRISILALLPFQPFFFNDQTFVGEAGDLCLLASSDFWYEFFNTLINGEQIIHGGPFVKQDSLLRDFFMVNPGLVHDDAVLALKLQEWLIKQPFYIQALARSFEALRDSYIVGLEERATTWSPPKEFASLETFIQYGPQISANKDLFFFPGANTMIATSQSAMNYLMSLPTTSTDERKVIDQLDLEFDQPPGRVSLNVLGQEAENFAAALNEAAPVPCSLSPPRKLGNTKIHNARRSNIIRIY